MRKRTSLTRWKRSNDGFFLDVGTCWGMGGSDQQLRGLLSLRQSAAKVSTGEATTTTCLALPGNHYTPLDDVVSSWRQRRGGSYIYPSTVYRCSIHYLSL